jgi:ubiquinol-cytochrome c reductase cytochrome c1 subunit
MVRGIAIAAVASAALLAGVAFAANEAAPPEAHHFSFDGPLGSYDMGAVQRGFQVYSQICSTCHSMEHLAYRNLGEPGGPFALYRVRNHQTGEMENRVGLPAGEHGEYVDVVNNPYVRAIAAGFQVPDIDQATGETTQRPARISDHFRKPFANEYAARAANNGALPPDLSSIVNAREGGAPYVRSLLLGYSGEQRGTQYLNTHFAGHLISMPPPLAADGLMTYSDGTRATREQMATDVANYLQWAADPHMEDRKAMGVQVLAFLLVLAGMLYLAYKAVWRGQSH